MCLEFPPGGTTDVIGRYIGQQLGDELGQPVVVDNRGGASGDIGSKVVSMSPADGYTLLLAPMGTMVINPSLTKTPAFDTVKEFTPIARVFDADVLIVVGPSVSANSLSDFIALAKSKPGQLNYGTPGTGTTPHLAAELFKSIAQVNMVHIPYRGGGPAVAAADRGIQIVLEFAGKQTCTTGGTWPIPDADESLISTPSGLSDIF